MNVNNQPEKKLSKQEIVAKENNTIVDRVSFLKLETIGPIWSSQNKF